MIDDASAPENADFHDPAAQEPGDAEPAASVADDAVAVAARVERELAELEKLSLAEHADAFARIHATLDNELAEIDSA